MSDNKQHTVKEGGSVNLGRHQAQCTVCQHPQRQEIEEAWIGWGYVERIAYVFGVSRDAIYRHMHALDLFGKRKENVMRALERVIETVEFASPSASAVVSAVKAYVELNSPAQATEQAQGSNPKELFERMSPKEREAFARDGSLPDWFPGPTGATPGDGQEGEKESQVTETTRVQ